MNYDSPKEISAFLKSNDIALRKKWGQNFLIAGDARDKMISTLSPDQSDLVWEIGPGLGAMTKSILDSGAKLVAFEIDRGMIRSLGLFFGQSENLTIVEGDFVKTFEKAIREFGEPSKILGNLPYSSASKIILMLIAKCLRTRTLIFTVQKELAQRMASAPRKKSYSSFSVLCQYAFDIEILTDLSPHSFFPQPDVVSSVIMLRPRERDPKPTDEALFFSVCRAAFASRRKTLYNNLLASGILQNADREIIENVIEKLGFPRGARAEELDMASFVSLSNLLVGK
jgi:16S rRNA (adenine1518-N6/adenine1519-N6)-dimethyltransferase